MSFIEKIKDLFGGQGELRIDRDALIERIRCTELFKDLPQENLEEMFDNMESVPMKAGQTVIRQGEEGDYYYLLCSGSAEVTRCAKPGDTPEVLATFSDATGFGEDALISNAKRNATITMKTRGLVMRLSKEGFNDYVKEPLVTWYSPMRAQKKIQEGAQWLDVRPAHVANQGHLPGAMLIPFEDIRERAATLDREPLYICYCDNGRQSSTAAFLLRQQGFSSAVMRGGMNSLKRAGLA